MLLDTYKTKKEKQFKKYSNKGCIDYKRHLKYHLRWQLGFIVCYPCMWLFSDVLQLPLWGAVVCFQFVGASIFYHVDNWIFNKRR